MCLNIVDLQRIFKQLDKNGDEHVSLDEPNWLLERIGVHLTPEELESFVGKSSLDLDEFFFFWNSISKQTNNVSSDVNDGSSSVGSEKEEEEEESALVEAFNLFDLNRDGFISSEELQSVLSKLGLWDEKSGKDCKRMIYMYDTNLDGVLDFQEFKNMMLLNYKS